MTINTIPRCEKCERTQNRYAARLERMAGLTELMQEPVKTAFWNIYANGVASPAETPTFAQRVNILQHQRDTAEAKVARLVDALTAAAQKFELYEAQHRAKGTIESDKKADVNADLADQMRAAIAGA